MSEYTKEELSKLLKKNKMTIAFSKVDGSYREMKCTLLDEFLPENKQIDVKDNHPNVIAVWDVENEGWRSFRLNSIISAEILK